KQINNQRQPASRRYATRLQIHSSSLGFIEYSAYSRQMVLNRIKSAHFYVTRYNDSSTRTPPPHAHIGRNTHSAASNCSAWSPPPLFPRWSSTFSRPRNSAISSLVPGEFAAGAPDKICAPTR